MREPLRVLPGLIADDTSFLIGKAGYVHTDKVRFHRGSPEVWGGWETITTTLLGGVCRDALAWTVDGDTNIAFGTHATLEVFNGGDLYDITPAGLLPGLVDGVGGVGYGTGAWGTGTYGQPSTIDTFPRTWSLANYGRTLLACPRGGTLYQWSNDITQPAVAVSNAPARITLIRSSPVQRQVLALGCNEEASGTFNPVAIRYSDVEDLTDWTTSTANLAGEVILPVSGRIVGAEWAGPYLFVWTDTQVFLGSFTGDPYQPWRFDRLGEGGLIGPNAAVVVGQTAYWMGADGRFRLCPAGGEPALLASPVREDMMDHLAVAQADKIKAGTNSAFGEALWSYPDERDGVECSRIVALNGEGQWSRSYLPRSCWIDAAPGIRHPVGVDPEGRAYYHERGDSANGAPLQWSLETADQYIGKSQSRMLVRGFWPDFSGQAGAITVTLVARDEPQAPDVATAVATLLPSDTRADFLVEGRLFRIRMEGAAVHAAMRLGLPMFDVVKAGEW